MSISFTTATRARYITGTYHPDKPHSPTIRFYGYPEAGVRRLAEHLHGYTPAAEVREIGTCTWIIREGDRALRVTCVWQQQMPETPEQVAAGEAEERLALGLEQAPDAPSLRPLAATMHDSPLMGMVDAVAALLRTGQAGTYASGHLTVLAAALAQQEGVSAHTLRALADADEQAAAEQVDLTASCPDAHSPLLRDAQALRYRAQVLRQLAAQLPA